MSDEADLVPHDTRGLLTVRLLYPERPTPNKTDLVQKIRERCGRVDLHDLDEQMMIFTLLDHVVTFPEGTAPTQATVVLEDPPLDIGKIEPALQQSWDWKEARSTVSKCRAGVVVAVLLARALPHKEHLALVHDVVLSVLESAPCQAMHWLPSQRVVDPDAYLRSKAPDHYDPIFPAINVRFFNISNREPGEMLMDSIGLATLGVPDVQCHFVGLDPDAVAQMLFNTAYYLFDRGDVIGDGHTVEGVQPGQRWRCQHENALVPPRRVVLDIDPGPPYGAGKRR